MLDTGATAFMLVSAMLVFLMTPGVAFFYGGLARRKNVVNTMFMSFVIIGVVAIVWILAGWSLAYGGDGSNPFFGGFDQLGCMGAVSDMLAEAVDPRRFDVSLQSSILHSRPHLPALLLQLLVALLLGV